MTQIISKKKKKRKRINVSYSNNNKLDFQKQKEINGFIVMSSKKIDVKKKTGLVLPNNFSRNIDKINSKKEKRRTLNQTKIYLKRNNKFFIYQETREKCIKKIGLKKKEIKEEICIYDRNNIKLFILVVYLPEIKEAKERVYLDMFLDKDKEKCHTQTDIYYDKIYFSNKNFRDHESYLNIFLQADIKSSTGVDININIKIIDLYYLLIGYV